MPVEIFKTSIKTKRDAALVVKCIKKIHPVASINFDLADCDKILRIEATDIQVQPILNLMTAFGITCILLD